MHEFKEIGRDAREFKTIFFWNLSLRGGGGNCWKPGVKFLKKWSLGDYDKRRESIQQ